MIISFVAIIYLCSLASISPGVITATMFFMLDLAFLPQVHHKIQMKKEHSKLFEELKYITMAEDLQVFYLPQM